MKKSAAGVTDIKGARRAWPVRRQDHDRPHLAGRFDQGSPRPLVPTSSTRGVGAADFNQQGTRRGNHEVMMRGTFANIRIRNHMPGPNGKEGGYTIHYPSKEEMSIYDAAMMYKEEGVPLAYGRRRIWQRLVAKKGLGGQGQLQPARRPRRYLAELERIHRV